MLETIRKQSKIKLDESINRISMVSLSLPNSVTDPCNVQLPFSGRGGSTRTSTDTADARKRKKNNSGFYYGITDDVFFPDNRDSEGYGYHDSTDGGSRISIKTRPPPSPPSAPRQNVRETQTSKTLTDIMGETLLELREMREDIYALREEMQYMKEEFKHQKEIASSYGYKDEIDEEIDQEVEQQDHQKGLMDVSAFEQIGHEVEKWAHKMLFEEDGEEYGWNEVKCNKMVRKKFNPSGQTTCYVKVSNTTPRKLVAYLYRIATNRVDISRMQCECNTVDERL